MFDEMRDGVDHHQRDPHKQGKIRVKCRNVEGRAFAPDPPRVLGVIPRPAQYSKADNQAYNLANNGQNCMGTLG